MRNVESRTITVIVPDWEEFGRICDKNGLDRSKKIRQWISQFIIKCREGKIKINV